MLDDDSTAALLPAQCESSPAELSNQSSPHQIAHGSSPSAASVGQSPSYDVHHNTSSGHSTSKNTCALQLFLWVIWFATCEDPLRISAINTPSRRLPEHEDIPPLSELTFVLLWLANGEIWKRVSPADLWIVIPSRAKRALIRLPNALNCTTFEKEHRLLHEQLKVLDPTQWKYISLIEPVPTHNCGEIFTIVAYGEHATAPTIFVLKLTKNGEIRWRDYPRLLAHILGEAEATYPPVIFHAWFPITHHWKDVDPDDNYRPAGDYDFALVRNKSNERALGLPRWLDHLAAQTKDPVAHRYGIPTIYTVPRSTKVVIPPPPLGSPSGLPANYLRTTNIVSPRAETMRAPSNDAESVKVLRMSASTPNLRRSATSSPGSRSFIDLADNTVSGTASDIKPLDIARKCKLSSSVDTDDYGSPLRRSPRKHNTRG